MTGEFFLRPAANLAWSKFLLKFAGGGAEHKVSGRSISQREMTSAARPAIVPCRSDDAFATVIAEDRNGNGRRLIQRVVVPAAGQRAVGNAKGAAT